MADRVLAGIAIALVVVSLAVGYGAAAIFGPSSPGQAGTTKTTTQTVENTTSPYILTLFVTTESIFNSTVGDQPAYFIMGPQGLQPATTLKVPAHRLIELVLVNYDDGNASLSDPSYANVTGTTGGTMFYGSNDMINASQGAGGISIAGGVTASKVPADQIAHTFTVPSLGLNVPLPVSAAVVVTFTINSAGTYTWFCMTACGSGDNGLGGAMRTPGWMTGSLVAT